MYDGAAVRWVRTLRGYSKRELAEKASVPERRVSYIENGGRATPDELQRLWRVLADDSGSVNTRGVTELA